MVRGTAMLEKAKDWKQLKNWVFSKPLIGAHFQQYQTESLKTKRDGKPDFVDRYHEWCGAIR